MSLKIKVVLIALIIIKSIPSTSYSQGNFIFINDEKYEATEEWDFGCSTYKWGYPYGLGVQIAKNPNGSGYLKLEIKVPQNNDSFSGNCYLFLEDGTKITCTDRGIRDHVDEMTISIFYLTGSEIELLKKSNIDHVRFSLSTLMGNENYTAYSTNIERSLNKCKTAPGVSSLFN